MLNISAIKERPFQVISSICGMLFSAYMMYVLVIWVVTFERPVELSDVLAGVMLAPFSYIWKISFDMLDGKKDLD